jgi:hypothetical protein
MSPFEAAAVLRRAFYTFSSELLYYAAWQSTCWAVWKLIWRTLVTVTTVSIRLALKKIAEITCGIAPSVIHVRAIGDPTRRVYAASIPWEYRAEIHSYLAQHLAISVQKNALILSSEQAEAVVNLAMRHLQDQATGL